MIYLYIDGVRMTPRNTTSVMPSYNIGKLKSVSAWRSGDDIEVEVESTPEIEAVMGHAADMHRAISFNDMPHEAKLSIDGTTVFEGSASLIATRSETSHHSYIIRLRGGGAEWAKIAALTPLSKSDIECNMALNLSSIESSWSDDSIVKYLPLQHDSYPKPKPAGLYAVEQMLMPQDYHPFISIKALVDKIIEKGGYKLQSDFMNSELFGQLMMSGAYRTTDCSAAENAMGFKAYRTTTTTIKAPQTGIVNLCMPLSVTHNIGPIVDSVDPSAVDEAGNRLADAYNNGGCLSFPDGDPVFTPTREVSVSFECFLHYTTECRMVSSKKLQGFTDIHLSNGCNVAVALQNPYIDKRNDVIPSKQYKLIVFDHQSGYKYRLEGIADNLSNECTVVPPSDAPTTTRLYYKGATDSSYMLFDGDWALYDGHVERSLSREITLTIRTPYMRVTPTSPKRFNDMQIGGGIEGQQITIHSGCYMRPIFSGTVGYGDIIKFEDIAHHNINQIAIIEALAHLFNLCIYTHKPSKKVYIETYDKFFNGEIVDWRHRQIDGKWEYEEGAPNCFESIRLCYAGNDGVVRRIAGEDNSYGEWFFSTPGYSSKMGTDSRINPLFYPTVSFTESTTSAPSAEVLTVGDRDQLLLNDYVEPRIVLYSGMRELPVNERWQAYNTLHQYPFVSFHSPDADATLDFNDRDGLIGLHQYHDRELRESSERGTFTCAIKMRPDEYLALLDPASEDANIRSRFRLKSEYGTSLFTLLSIEEYDTSNYIAKCRFRRTLTD